MKRLTFILVALMGFTAATSSNAAATPGLSRKIVAINPSSATIGQTIIVRTQVPNQPGINLPAKPPALSTVKVFFTSATGLVQGTNLAVVDSNRYSVRVPAGARSGFLRLQIGNRYSTSTTQLTITMMGYMIVNSSQFKVISVKVDGEEKLAPQVIPAGPPGGQYEYPVATSAGSHVVSVLLGPDTSHVTIGYSITHQASNLLNESELHPIEVTPMLAGEYLVNSSNVTLSNNGNNASLLWYDAANGTTLLRGFDFTLNMTTGVTTWKRWSENINNVLDSGTVTEPTSWILNPTGTLLQLRRNNGSLFDTININFLNASFTSQGNTFNRH